MWCYLDRRNAQMEYWDGRKRVRSCAKLVCNNLGDETCINPKKGLDGRDSWEKRFDEIQKKTDDLDK